MRTGKPRPRLGEQPVDPGGRQRRREEVALPHLASQLDERFALLDALDALGHRLQLESLPSPMMARASADLSKPAPTSSTNGRAILIMSMGNRCR